MSTITTMNGSTVSVEAMDDFAAHLRGKLITPSSPEYDTARTIWNGMIDRRPSMIVQCAGAADVIHAVKFARQHHLLVSIKGAGHNIAGNAMCDNGLVIDLSQMKSIRVDPKSKKAWVQPGATLRDLDHETQAFGLAMPVGINSTTGIAGLTLGGGFGWLTRKYGVTVDNLLSADIITANGDLVHASANENPDLFWGIRGGGGNFGVVTTFEFQLHPVGPEIFAGLIVFPFEQARSVLMKYRELAATLSEEFNIWAVLRKAPPLPFLPEQVHGKEVVVFPIFSLADVSMSEKIADQVRAFGTPVGEHVGMMPYTAWQQAFDPLLTPGARNYWKSHNFTELNDAMIDTVLDAVTQLPSPHCEIFIGMMGGGYSRVDSNATAYTHRDAEFVINVHSRWETPQEDDTCIQWARDFFNKAAPYATGGVYVNFMTEEESDRVQGGAYKSDVMNRLTQVKDKWDPTNFFCMNQNIKPSVS